MYCAFFAFKILNQLVQFSFTTPYFTFLGHSSSFVSEIVNLLLEKERLVLSGNQIPGHTQAKEFFIFIISLWLGVP